MSRAGGGEVGAEERDGAGTVAGLLVSEGEIFLGGVVGGVGAQGGLQLANSRWKLAETDEDGTERAVALFGGGIETDDLGEAGLCGVEVATAERGETGAVG